MALTNCPYEPAAPGDGYEGQGDSEIASLRLSLLAARLVPGGGCRPGRCVSRSADSGRPESLATPGNYFGNSLFPSFLDTSPATGVFTAISLQSRLDGLA